MSSQIKTIKDHAVQNKRVLLRVDFNVSLDKEGSIADDAKMKETLPTIHLLLKEKNKLIIISHLGRPASANASAGKQRLFAARHHRHWSLAISPA